eukprot:scaffold154751_cov34-Tisochrysis_lutea.AAC.1
MHTPVVLVDFGGNRLELRLDKVLAGLLEHLVHGLVGLIDSGLGGTHPSPRRAARPPRHCSPTKAGTQHAQRCGSRPALSLLPGPLSLSTLPAPSLSLPLSLSLSPIFPLSLSLPPSLRPFHSATLNT